MYNNSVWLVYYTCTFLLNEPSRLSRPPPPVWPFSLRSRQKIKEKRNPEGGWVGKRVRKWGNSITKCWDERKEGRRAKLPTGKLHFSKVTTTKGQRSL
jgi:hypothetical protein